MNNNEDKIESFEEYCKKDQDNNKNLFELMQEYKLQSLQLPNLNLGKNIEEKNKNEKIETMNVKKINIEEVKPEIKDKNKFEITTNEKDEFTPNYAGIESKLIKEKNKKITTDNLQNKGDTELTPKQSPKEGFENIKLDIDNKIKSDQNINNNQVNNQVNNPLITTESEKIKNT